jgi:DNA-binding LacI/PurR family transcriptional regulator
MKEKITNTKHKSRFIAEELRQKIRRGQLQPGMAVMSAPEIAKKYKVCLMTANRALDILKEEALIVRIKGSGSFVNKNIFGGRKLVLGIADHFCPEDDTMIRKTLLNSFPESALAALKKANCSYRILHRSSLVEQDREVFSDLDGLLISSSSLEKNIEPFISSLNIPIVIYRAEMELPLPFSQVIPDHSAAMAKLFSLAQREKVPGIVILYPEHPNGTARFKAFFDSAVKAGFRENEISSAALQNISEAPELARRTAGAIRGKLVVSCSDFITVKVVPVWAELDLFCGKEYLLASYDNLQAILPAAFATPGITSIDYSRSGAAQMAVKLLIQSVINRQKQFYQTVKFPTRLIIRESAFEQYKYTEDSL